MICNFAKMHGLGNDFVILDLIREQIKLTPKLIQSITARATGVGCDQLLTIEAPHSKDAEFFFRIYNNDGSEAEQCGNAARCLAKFANITSLTYKTKFIAECLAGKVNMHVINLHKISASLPFNPQHEIETIEHPQLGIIYLVNLGNPHAICFVEKLNKLPLYKLGAKLSKSLVANSLLNVSFVEIMSKDEAKIRVFERGAGLTLSCGSGAGATLLAAKPLNKLNNPCNLKFPQGSLEVEVLENSVKLTGPAKIVFHGKFKI